MEVYLSFSQETKTCCFAIAGRLSDEELLKRNHRAILFPETMPLYTITAMLDQSVLQYNQWHKQVMDEIYKGKNIQDILELAASVLPFPLALFDKHSILLAQAGEVTKDEEGSVWDDVLANYHFSNDEY